MGVQQINFPPNELLTIKMAAQQICAYILYINIDSYIIVCLTDTSTTDDVHIHYHC